ncbi:MAG: glycine cleavage system protein GcvH [Spirochaetaceae bacterium]|nr:MAG: glycine cleavage system protein GcvH [Spirochaetaceae bacterium]
MAEYLYSKDHQWILMEGNSARVGISEFAQSELGEIAFVELPTVGRRVERGETVCSVDSLKSTSEIYAPVSGIIAQVNETLTTDEKACAIINADPLGRGWLFVVEMSQPGEVQDMLNHEQYNRYLESG